MMLPHRKIMEYATAGIAMEGRTTNFKGLMKSKRVKG
jgi:hypothetical protein